MTSKSSIFSQTDTNKAPSALKKTTEISQHGITRLDHYAWLRDEQWQEVLRDPSTLDADIRQHLEAENQYYENTTQDLQELRTKLFKEMRGRIKEDDSTVPNPHGPFAYSVKYREGGDYPIFIRTLREGGDEEILFDGDHEGKGSDYFDISDVAHSHDHTMIAYAVDHLGSEYFDIRIRNIKSGKEYEETISSTNGDPIWAADSASLFYVERDENQRPKRVKRHQLGTEPISDEIIYEEPDDSFFLSITESQSGAFLFLESSKSTSSEVRFLPTDAPPNTSPTLIAPRQEDELYSVEHHGDYFYILTNRNKAIDFKICRTLIENPDRSYWQEWLSYDPGTYITAMIPFKHWIVRLQRKNALPEIIISNYDRNTEYAITFDEDAYALELDPGYEFDTDFLRFTYSSPTTPQQTFDYNITTRERSLIKTKEIPGGHDPDRYQVERIFVTAKDGAEIPVTIIRLKTTPVNGSAPLLLYGYGAYGITIPASFNSHLLSLVDRGVTYAIAHIRGGAAKGRQWYLDGKLGKKSNTFSDFATVAETLQTRGYGQKDKTVIYGGSAGGLLVGAAVNLRPDLFAGVIGAVPFVDVITTISDATLPLTPPEWVEWGDPIQDAKAFHTISSYSPYDNIKTDQHYPPILATGGLTDYRVTYWEPAKWIARLRAENPGGPFFLKMNMEAGHGGSAARFEQLRERAHDYAFALKIFGLTE